MVTKVVIFSGEILHVCLSLAFYKSKTAAPRNSNHDPIIGNASPNDST